MTSPKSEPSEVIRSGPIAVPAGPAPLPLEADAAQAGADEDHQDGEDSGGDEAAHHQLPANEHTSISRVSSTGVG